MKRRHGLAHFALAYVLRYAGLLKEAQRECDTALALDPGNYYYRSCVRAFFLDGDFQRALEYLALDMGSDYSKRNEVEIFLRQGKKTEALEIVHTLTDNRMRLVEACLRARPEPEIEALSKQALNRAMPDPEMGYALADYEAFCGRHEVPLGLQPPSCPRQILPLYSHGFRSAICALAATLRNSEKSAPLPLIAETHS